MQLGTDAAVLAALCHGRPTLHSICRNPRDPKNNNAPGFFSQLNVVAQSLFEAMLRGERPLNASVLYEQTRLVGYGNPTFGTYFAPYNCGSAQMSAPVQLDRAGSRYQLYASLLRLLFTPVASRRAANMPMDPSARPFDLAIHVRRGDRVSGRNVQATHERLHTWSVEAVANQSARLLHHSENPVVLVASDDAAYLETLVDALGRMRLRTKLVPPPTSTGGKPAGAVCDVTCVPPLVELIELFSRAHRFIVNVKSNMGTFFLTRGGVDAVPDFVDMDGVLQPSLLAQDDRYFCDLAYEARHGFCSVNTTYRGRHRCAEGD